MDDRITNPRAGFTFQSGLKVCSNHYEDVFLPDQLYSGVSHDGLQNTTNISLCQACAEGNLCLVQFILSQRPNDINSPDKVGRTPVMEAVRMKQVSVFDFLCAQSCDLTAIDNNNDTVLHVACEVGAVDIVRKLLVNYTCDLERRGNKGRTPVMKSALHGHRDVLDLLVSRGCNVTILDDNMNNILHVACIGGHVHMVEYLLRMFICNIESRGENGRTPVMIAAFNGHIKVFDFLVSNGSNMRAVDDNEDNTLHVACIGGHVDMVQHILNKTSINIDSKGKYGRTPVIRATENDQKSVVKFLVSKQCNLRAVDQGMNNVLHFACVAGHLHLLKDFISNGKIPIDAVGEDGYTPVMIAVQLGYRRIVEYLVRIGCNMTTSLGNGDTVLHLACYSGRVDMVKFILSLHQHSIDCLGHYKRTPVMAAASLGFKHVAIYLVSKGCNISLKDNEDNNILHLVCMSDRSQLSIVKYIVEKLDIKVESKGYLGKTAVMYAVRYGKMDVVKYLVSRGCNVSLDDDEGNNILHTACMSGSVNMVKYITSQTNISIESRGHNGLTPVMTAACMGHLSIVKYLVAKGCKLLVVNNDGNNILHLTKYIDIFRYILSQKRILMDARGQFGYTPMMVAANLGYLSSLKFLVKQGCNLTLLDTNHDNILHLACTGGHVNTVKYIVEKLRFGIESRGQMDLTPVMVAAYFGQTSVVKYLVGKGCNLTNVIQGINILDLACMRHHHQVVKYLMTLKSWPKTCGNDRNE